MSKNIDELKAFLSNDFAVEGIPDEVGVAAGALAAGAVKVPVQTFIGNLSTIVTNLPFLGIGRLLSGNPGPSWTIGAGQGHSMSFGDLTIGNNSITSQRVKGSAMANALNDDDRAMAVLGREWREIQTIDNTTIPGGSLALVPARDTHRIFIYRDNSSSAFRINLASLGLQAGMKFMFVNLSAAETAGTNEVQTLTEGTNITAGTFTISFGGQTTTAIQHDAIAATVQTALEALSSIGAGNITVTGGPVGTTPFTLTFRNALGGANVDQVTVDVTNLTGTITVATTTPGVATQGRLMLASNGAGIAGANVYQLALSRGAVVVLQAVHPDVAETLGFKYIITHRFGTVTAS